MSIYEKNNEDFLDNPIFSVIHFHLPSDSVHLSMKNSLTKWVSFLFAKQLLANFGTTANFQHVTTFLSTFFFQLFILLKCCIHIFCTFVSLCMHVHN